MVSQEANRIHLVNDIGQSVWIDHLSRDLVRSGELARLVQLGVSGVTSNPTIFQKAVENSHAYDAALARYARAGGDPGQAFEDIAVEDIRAAADVLSPVYTRTGGADGFVSIEVNPHFAHHTAATVTEARRLFSSIGRPNVMIKVPGTPAGMPAIRQLTAEGVNVNITLLFSVKAYRDAAQAYMNGLSDRVGGNAGSLNEVSSVASFFVSRLDTAVDRLLDMKADSNGGVDVSVLRGLTGIANARVAYSEFTSMFGSAEFAPLEAKGARRQRPLWGSTSVKNPAYPDTLYVDNLIGPDSVNTMPVETLEAFLDHGIARETVTRDLQAARAVIEQVERIGISLDDVTSDLLRAGIDSFIESYDSLLETVSRKLSDLAAA